MNPQNYYGVVLEIDMPSNQVWIRIVNETDGEDEIIVEITAFSETDRPLLQEGSYVEYTVSDQGALSIRVNTSNRWTQAEIDEAARRAKELKDWIESE